MSVGERSLPTRSAGEIHGKCRGGCVQIFLTLKVDYLHVDHNLLRRLGQLVLFRVVFMK